MIETPGPSDFEFGAGGLWILGGGYAHWMTEGGRSRLDCFASEGTFGLDASRSALPSCILRGRGNELCELYDGQLFAFPVVLGTRHAERIFPIGPRLLAVSTLDRFRIVHLEKGNLFCHQVPLGNRVRSVTPVFGGTAVVVTFSGAESQLWLLTPSGDRIATVPISRPDLVAVAEDRGIAIIGTEQSLCAIDLRHGEVRDWAKVPFRIDDMDVCARARMLVLAQRQNPRPRTFTVRYSEIFTESR